jgi:hypothetical protein
MAKKDVVRAIRLAGGGAAIARALWKRGEFITPQAVHKWKKKLPEERAALLYDLCSRQVALEKLK